VIPAKCLQTEKFCSALGSISTFLACLENIDIGDQLRNNLTLGLTWLDTFSKGIIQGKASEKYAKAVKTPSL